MHLPLLPLSRNHYIYTEGEVSIDPSAAISSGVILRADPDSKIIIGDGVCIGIGAILHAHQGILEVEAGANLGAGVLVVGQGKIGINACIGALTTIWNASIEPWQVVPPSSLVGDQGRQSPDISKASTASDSLQVPDTTSSSTNTMDQFSVNGQAPSTTDVVSTETSNADLVVESPMEQQNPEVDSSVYGQGNLNRLLKTLFPYNNQSFTPPPDDG